MSNGRHLSPLSTGNRLQQADHRRAAPYYVRMSPELREQSELIDRFLYSRRGLVFWFALVVALVGSAFGLRQAGLPTWLAAALSLLLWGVTLVRRQIVERQMLQVRLEHERHSAARQAAEARLKLLQGQIRTHFIFNTLSAVQRWVDSGDVRGGPLLRSLTAFLHGSTDALGQDRVTLADEAAMVRHYLSIMLARLGERLQVVVEIEPAVAGQRLPPGLVLTLVENAVKHGVQPALGGATVAVSASAARGRVIVEVHDDGAGLDPQAAEGVGLSNSRQRLAQAWADAATLTLPGPNCASWLRP